MTRLLDAIARAATRIPSLTLALLAVITVVLAGAATTLEVDTGLEGFAPEGGAAATLDEIEERFSTTTTVQVLVDDGPGGNVLDQDTLADAVELKDRLVADPDIAPVLADDDPDDPSVVPFAVAIEAAFDGSDDELGEMDQASFESLATAVLDDGGDDATGLFSDDLETDPPRARSGLVVVDLDASAPSDERAEAARAVQRIVDETPVGEARRSVLSATAIEDGVEESLERETPILLSVSLLLVVIVLTLLFRSVVDVVVGLTGLLVSIVWMVGISALLGPGNLGLTGPFNQISIAVPVLLVGLGIDYSVHLTTRYREQRRRGDDAVMASRIALGTVGVALTLATAASVAGFLANMVTPLPPIRDFGIFSAIGIVAAFVVLGTAVPASRTLIDHRKDRRAAEAAIAEASPQDGDVAPPQDGEGVPPRPGGDGVPPQADDVAPPQDGEVQAPEPSGSPTPSNGDPLADDRDAGVTLEVPLSAFQPLAPAETAPLDDPAGGEPSPAGSDGGNGREPVAATSNGATDVERPPARWSTALTSLATRRPLLAIGATVLALALGAIAATGLSTEFDERDFLPEGEPVLLTLDRLDEQFGGDVGEQTFVLVDGDASDRDVLEAIAELPDRLVDVDDVRINDGDAEVTSPVTLRDRIAAGGEGVRERLADDLETWQDPEAAAADIDLPDELDTDAFEDELDDSVELPDDLEEALGGRLADGRSALAALVATSDPDELEADIRDQLAEDLAEDRPDDLDDQTLDELAARPAEELTLARLEEAGYPMEDLGEDELDQLEQLEALEQSGPVDSTDGQVLAAHLEVLQDEVPDEAAGVIDEDGLLVSVSTLGGQDGAERLTSTIARIAEPVEAAGGDVTVVSEPVVNQEIIDEMSAAQLIAIAISLAAAAALLVIATWFSSRAVGLGLIGIVPSLVALVLVLGAMRGLGLAFNALTATVASIAVGIGVPYGIHLTNRFREGISTFGDPDRAVREALTNTGPALVGSAMTTGLAFAVLMLSTSTPLQQFGIVSTLMIGLALLGCLFVQPSLLVLWGRRLVISGGPRRRRGTRSNQDDGPSTGADGRGEVTVPAATRS